MPFETSNDDTSLDSALLYGAVCRQKAVQSQRSVEEEGSNAIEINLVMPEPIFGSLGLERREQEWRGVVAATQPTDIDLMIARREQVINETAEKWGEMLTSFQKYATATAIVCGAVILPCIIIKILRQLTLIYIYIYI